MRNQRGDLEIRFAVGQEWRAWSWREWTWMPIMWLASSVEDENGKRRGRWKELQGGKVKKTRVVSTARYSVNRQTEKAERWPSNTLYCRSEIKSRFDRGKAPSSADQLTGKQAVYKMKMKIGSWGGIGKRRGKVLQGGRVNETEEHSTARYSVDRQRREFSVCKAINRSN